MNETVAAGWDCHVHVFDAALPSPGSHYRTVDRPLSQIEALARQHGVGHLVLVQPSVYGSDNSLLLQALSQTPGRHRGVVVVPGAVADAALQAMHEQGVRGVRFNLVSPMGEAGLPTGPWAMLAARLQRLGWHVQWYARHRDLPAIAALHRDSGLPCVLDHLAGLVADLDDDGPAWRALEDLAAQGAWIKVSGLYRLQSPPPHAELAPHIRRLARLFGGHLLWGSDWPHTAFAPDALPRYESTWQPLVDALGAAARDVLQRHPLALYR